MNSAPNQEPGADPIAEETTADQIAEELVEATVAPTDSEDESIDSLKQQLSEMEKTALRHQADMENFRKRTRTQMDEQLKYASLPLLTELLESADNLNRASESAKTEGESSALLQGVTMVAAQLSLLLDKHGCKPIESVGQPFDPNCHQAVQMQPSDEYPANTVMHEIRSGFKLHDRVIRPAQVFVSTGPDSKSE
ncbi:nucleotide exchange factor GrpE [bacterium]|nr:nucleotide exchange factor GrpE [bacterium]